MRCAYGAAALLALVAVAACGGSIASSPGESADASSASAASDASSPSDAASDTGPGAAPDAHTPCTAPPPVDPTPGPGQCVLPSGRLCAGTCKCDDGCNTCACLAGGGYSTTDIACLSPPPTPTCDANDVTPSCRQLPAGDFQCPGGTRPYFCAASVLAACGANACPFAQCALSHATSDGSFWCCP